MHRTILIVDDSAMMRRHVARALGMCLDGTTTVLEAADGMAAIDLIRMTRPDAVFSDLNMPRMSGEALVEAIRASDPEGLIPVVIVSSEPDPDVVRRLTARGVRGFIPKPFTQEDFTRVTIGALSGGASPGPVDHELFPWALSPPDHGRPTGGEPRPRVQNYGALLREALLTALETSAHLSPERAAIDRAAIPPEHLIMASISFSGPAEGRIDIVADAELGRIIAAHLLGADDAGGVTLAEACDAVAELANIVCGLILRAHEDDPAGVPRIGLPRRGEGTADDWRQALSGGASAALVAEGRRLAARVVESVPQRAAA